METQSLIEKIIDNARWAPSGDNMQTWRFQIIDETHFVIHGYDTRDHCVYDLEGHASQLAIGALLESITIAAREFLHEAEFKFRADMPENKPTFDVYLHTAPDIKPDPLFSFLPIRSVQRRNMKTTPLTIEQKQALQQAVGNEYTVLWLESFIDKAKTAWLMVKNAKLRLTLPEAFPTHSTIIEWNAQFSNDKIPDQAVGLDPLATKLMKWALKSWERVNFLNKYLSGTVLPRIELDLLPGLCCAAHIVLVAEKPAETPEDYLRAGRAVQRFWLTACQLDLQLQPEMTPLIFSGYIRKKLAFTKTAKLLDFAAQLEQSLAKLIGVENSAKAVFAGRIGNGERAAARSLRLPIKDLMALKAE